MTTDPNDKLTDWIQATFALSATELEQTEVNLIEDADSITLELDFGDGLKLDDRHRHAILKLLRVTHSEPNHDDPKRTP